VGGPPLAPALTLEVREIVPARFLDDDTPVIEFDPRLEISPFALFRRLREGDPPLLVDVRSEPGEMSLSGAVSWGGAGWVPPDERDVVLFDDDGAAAADAAGRLQAAGHLRVRALFGGLALYDFALDPAVVGGEVFLVRPGR
jgi:hypothetical protein